MADPLRQPTAPPKPALARFSRWLWNQQGFLWGTVIVGIALNLFASWLITPLGTSFSQTPLGTFLGHPLFFVLAGVGLLFLTGGLWLINRLSPAPPSQRISARPLTQSNRQSVIRLFRQEYGKRLAQSLQGAVMVTLRLHERTEVVRSSAHLVFRRTDLVQEMPHPPGTTILQAYEQAGQRLLILGAPGAGKTTLLLGLAEALLARAQSDPAHPIAVILNLSSWADKKPPLDLFLIDQLSLVYGIPSRLGQTLLEQELWLLLLDGLDEVETSARSACIEAINRYREEHFAPLVVCSRSQEYVQEQALLALSGAVEIQPLQEQEVKEYLGRLGKPMAAVRAALRTNPLLKQLLTTPLMLNVVILTYRDKAAKALPQLGTGEEQQQQIFTRYVKRMLERGPIGSHYTPQQMYQWLTWLAQQMKQHHLTEFYLEWLQPSWLTTRRAQIVHQLFSCLVVGLVTGLVTGLLIGSLVGLITGLPGGLFFGLLGGLFFALLIGLVVWRPGERSKKMIREEIHPTEILEWSRKRFWQWLFFGLLAGLLVGLLTWLLVGRLDWLVVGLFAGPLFGLTRGVSGAQISKDMRTRPNQGIRNSGWNALGFGLLVGLPAALLIVVAAWLFGGEQHPVNQPGGLGGGIFTGLLFALLGKRFFRLMGGLCLGVLGVLLGVLLGGLPFALPAGLLFGLLNGLLVGLLVGLSLGGEAYLKHYILRYLFIRSGVMPWHYVRFLEEATERILLQRVGGGYRFIHPLFLDYFASLGTQTSPSTQPQLSSP